MVRHSTDERGNDEANEGFALLGGAVLRLSVAVWLPQDATESNPLEFRPSSGSPESKGEIPVGSRRLWNRGCDEREGGRADLVV